MGRIGGRAVLLAMTLAALSVPASAIAARGSIVVTHGVSKLVPAGARVPVRQPVALKTFRTLDPLALEAGRAAAAQQYQSTSSRQSAVVAPRSTLFNGLSWDGLAATDTVDVTPPDGGGGIGPNNFVEAINERITVYNRGTTASVSTADLSTFTGLSGTCDPYVMWDQGAQRWVIISIECASLSDHALSIAFTKSTDPTDLVNGWCKYTLDTGGEFPDYPKAGHNNSDWLVGVNDYSTSTSSFDTAELIAFRKPANGTITTCPGSLSSATATGTPLSANGDTVFTAEPPDQVDSSAPPSSGTASDNGYFVAYQFGTGSAIHVFQFHRDSAGTAHFTFEGDIGVASYTTPGVVPQPGTTDTLSSSDTRGVGATAHADPKRCGGCEAVWVTHTVNGAGGRSQVQWQELNPASCTGTASCPGSALLQDGDVSSSTLFDFNGRMAPAGNGYEAVMNFDSGSSTRLSQINAISNTLADPAGGTHGQILIATSAGPDEDFSCSPTCRWGDYAAAETDPTNNFTVWNNSMYLAAPNSGNAQWKTRLFAVKPEGPATSVNVHFSPSSIIANGASTTTATATVTDSSGTQVVGETVAFSSSDPGEHIGSVTDNGDGTYSATITGSKTQAPATITATDSSAGVSGSAVLSQTTVNVAVALSPNAIVADGLATTTAIATVTDAAGHRVPGDNVSLSSSDSGDKIGSVTDRGDGTYIATIIGSFHTGQATITATDGSVSPGASGSVGLTHSPLVGRVKVHGTTALVPLNCTGATPCSVNLSLNVTEEFSGGTLVAVTASTAHGKTRRKVVVIGKATVTVSGGARNTVQVKLNKLGLRLLESRHHLSAELLVQVGGSTVFSQTLHFKAPKKKH